MPDNWLCAVCRL